MSPYIYIDIFMTSSLRASWTNDLIFLSYVLTVVKELRSKMFRQHPGYYQAVLLKKTQTIIIIFFEYTVYIMFWIMMLYNCYYYYCHFLSKNHCFLQCKIRFCLKVIRNPASKSLQSIEISLYLAFTNEWNVAKKEKWLMNDLFYLKRYYFVEEKSISNCYSLKLDVNRCFWNPALSNW
jgi:hypothetical protein